MRRFLQPSARPLRTRTLSFFAALACCTLVAAACSTVNEADIQGTVDAKIAVASRAAIGALPPAPPAAPPIPFPTPLPTATAIQLPATPTAVNFPPTATPMTLPPTPTPMDLTGLGGVPGPKGDPGPTGQAGADGATGATGPAGPAGSSAPLIKIHHNGGEIAACRLDPGFTKLNVWEGVGCLNVTVAKSATLVAVVQGLLIPNAAVSNIDIGVATTNAEPSEFRNFGHPMTTEVLDLNQQHPYIANEANPFTITRSLSVTAGDHTIFLLASSSNDGARLRNVSVVVFEVETAS